MINHIKLARKDFRDVCQNTSNLFWQSIRLEQVVIIIREPFFNFSYFVGCLRFGRPPVYVWHKLVSSLQKEQITGETLTICHHTMSTRGAGPLARSGDFHLGRQWRHAPQSRRRFVMARNETAFPDGNKAWLHHIWKLGEDTHHVSATRFFTHFGWVSRLKQSVGELDTLTIKCYFQHWSVTS